MADQPPDPADAVEPQRASNPSRDAGADDEAAAVGSETAGSPAGGAPSTVREPPPRLAPLEVGVRHGSLEHAPYRLLVGHFQGLPLSGAEDQLNKRSDGRLDRLLLMNQYPQRLGEIVVLDPVDEAPPQGAVVLGLGPSGELAGAQLRDIVTRALLRVALNELDRRLAAVDSPRPPLGVSTVLIGASSAGGLTVESSMRALIDGTLAANGRLTRLKVPVAGEQRPATDIVAFEALEFIERYEDRVDLIAAVLAGLQRLEGRQLEGDAGAHQPVHHTTRPERGEGRSGAGSPIDAADEVWRRIDIRGSDRAPDGTMTLEFTSLGRLAGAAQRLTTIAERAILDPLLAGAIHDNSDPQISGTLYELLVPHELKGELGAGEHLHLLVDQSTADIPWELMRSRGDEPDQHPPLALRVGILRQFRETESVRFDVRRAAGNQALVIGNPPAPSFARLPGAMEETSAVADLLRGAGWQVEALIWDASGQPVTAADPPVQDGATPRAGGQSGMPPLRALHRLLNGEWRVVHIAAHGDFGSDPNGTGIVLGDLRLTANVLSKMSVVPDLVVINACHLGRVLDGANRAAASVGRALLKLGVRAVVVAGWAVDDAAARAFGERLHSELLAGADFGRAVSLARRSAWAAQPSSVTWGAYQCYGDPGFRLTTGPGRLDLPDIQTAGELRRRAQRLRSTASDQGRSTSGAPAADGAIEEDLRSLRVRAVELGSWEGLAEIADTWAELLDLRTAIRLYRQVIARGGSNVTTRTIEQLGNMLSRRARQLHRRGIAQARVDLFAAAADSWLARALELGPTGERLGLVAGHQKRLATMTSGAQRDQHLLEALKFLVAAKRLAPKGGHELNARQLVAVMRLNGMDPARWSAVLAADDETGGAGRPAGPKPAVAAGPVRVKPDIAADFWARAAEGDRRVTAALESAADGGSSAAPAPDPVPEIIDAYEAAFRLRSSARERDSVTTHLLDLADLLAPGSAPATILDGAHRRLVGWSAS